MSMRAVTCSYEKVILRMAYYLKCDSHSFLGVFSVIKLGHNINLKLLLFYPLSVLGGIDL